VGRERGSMVKDMVYNQRERERERDREREKKKKKKKKKKGSPIVTNVELVEVLAVLTLRLGCDSVEHEEGCQKEWSRGG
jgi:hypothetical protein